MKLSTIWSLEGLSTPERLRRTREWGAMTVARKLPLRVRYWTTMQEIAKATRKSPNIPATPLDEIIRNLEAPK